MIFLLILILDIRLNGKKSESYFYKPLLNLPVGRVGIFAVFVRFSNEWRAIPFVGAYNDCIPFMEEAHKDCIDL